MGLQMAWAHVRYPEWNQWLQTAPPADVAKILRTAEVRQELAALGAEPVGDTPEEFAATSAANFRRFFQLVRPPDSPASIS